MMTISTDASTVTGIELAEARDLLILAMNTLYSVQPEGSIASCWAVASQIRNFLIDTAP